MKLAVLIQHLLKNSLQSHCILTNWLSNMDITYCTLPLNGIALVYSGWLELVHVFKKNLSATANCIKFLLKEILLHQWFCVKDDHNGNYFFSLFIYSEYKVDHGISPIIESSPQNTILFK